MAEGGGNSWTFPEGPYGAQYIHGGRVGSSLCPVFLTGSRFSIYTFIWADSLSVVSLAVVRYGSMIIFYVKRGLAPKVNRRDFESN